MVETNIRVAFGSVPKDSGTFTFYRNQRPALLKLGVDLMCVTVGREEAYLWQDEYADEGCVLLASRERNVKKQAQAFVKWCEQQKVDVVIGVNSCAILSAIPHLPPEIRAVARCANAFDHGYRITLSGEPRLERIIALTPRLKYDLINQYGADEAKMALIPNGIDAERFKSASLQSRGEGEKLQLAFVGRLEHNQKGVMHLPKIVQALNQLQVNFELKIAGKGKHREQLLAELSQEIEQGQVFMLGALEPEGVISLLASSDVYLFTSHFEGCPNALLEAMMAGCVPVSWLIEGITDFIIDHGRTGFVHTTSDYEGFAASIARLDDHREEVKSLSTAVREEAEERFTTEVCATAYAKELQTVLSHAPLARQARPWSAFKADPNFEKGKLDFLPPHWRKRIKTVLGR